MKRSVPFLFVLFLAFTAELFAQGVGASGDISGTIKDSSGALMQNVTVAVVDSGRSTRHIAVTNSVGQYRIANLSPTTYEVSAAISGFES